MSKHRKKTGPRFVQLFYFMLESKAWKDLNAVERAIYVELTERYNGTNNGRIGYSARMAADEFKDKQRHGGSRITQSPGARIHRGSRNAERFTARSAMPANIG